MAGVTVGMGQPIVTIYTTGAPAMSESYMGNVLPYIVSVAINGQFAPANILWSGENCTGTPYLLAQGNNVWGYTRTVVYSQIANELFALAGGNATVGAASVQYYSSEGGGAAVGSSQCYPYMAPGGMPGSLSGWQLVRIDPAAALDWTVSGNPLSVAGPLRLP
jgi:hypothetical protein